MEGGSARDVQVWLAMGVDGRRELRREASARGLSMAGLVASRACEPVTYDGRSAVADDSLSAAVDAIRELGECVARIAALASALPVRASADETETSRILDEAWDLAGLSASAESALLAVLGDGVRQDAAMPATIHAEPRGGINVRLTRAEADALRACAGAAGLPAGDWVLVSCTGLGRLWSPLDAEAAVTAVGMLTSVSNNSAEAAERLRRMAPRAPVGADLSVAAEDVERARLAATRGRDLLRRSIGRERVLRR